MEKGTDPKTKNVLVEVSPEYSRPADVDFPLGNASKARKRLGWKPNVKSEELAKIMVDADLRRENVKRIN